MKSFTETYFSKTNLLNFSLLVSIVSTLGSLYFSEILKFPPCNLCWYQRVFMYPLVLILLVAIFSRDYKVHKYVLPLSFIGTVLAIYHVLLQEGIIVEDLSNCVYGVPCTSEYLRLFGVITIPFMSMLAYTSITLSMLILKTTAKTRKRKTIPEEQK